MPIPEELRNRIRLELKKRNWSQRKLQEETGIAQSTISKILSGSTENASIKTLDSIANSLGFRIDIKLKKK